MKKTLICLTLIAALCFVIVGCGSGSSSGGEGGTDTPRIQLDGASISAPDGVSVDGTTAVITKAGTYEITGKLDNGQIRVNVPKGNVTLILNNADITCETTSPIFVQKAKNVYLQLADGSSNIVTDGAEYQFASGETEPEATIYSKADLIINGTGSLTVNANYKNAIEGRDTLTIESGTLNITSVNHGIKGKDNLIIKGGNITVNAGNDGIKSTNKKDAKLGYVEISGGNVGIIAADEAISAVTHVTVSGGTVNIDTANNGIKTDGFIDISGGTINIQTEDKDFISQGECNIGEGASVTVNGEQISG